jgi:hypothetical protein
MARIKKYKVDISDLHLVLRELLTAEDRTAAIVGAAFVEDGLEQILRVQFQATPKIIDGLFQPDSPLGSFRAKIDLSFAIGTIGPVAHHDMSIIKDVRNSFAHNMLTAEGKAALTFKNQQIDARCCDLKFVKAIQPALPINPQHHLPRELFVWSCATYHARLYYILTYSKNVPRKPLIP